MKRIFYIHFIFFICAALSGCVAKEPTEIKVIATQPEVDELGGYIPTTNSTYRVFQNEECLRVLDINTSIVYEYDPVQLEFNNIVPVNINEAKFSINNVVFYDYTVQMYLENDYEVSKSVTLKHKATYKLPDYELYKTVLHKMLKTMQDDDVFDIGVDCNGYPVLYNDDMLVCYLYSKCQTIVNETSITPIDVFEYSRDIVKYNSELNGELPELVIPTQDGVHIIR